MKRFFALLMAAVMLVGMAVPALAGQQTVVDLGEEDLGNGITCKSTLVIEENLTRASQKCGYVIREYSYQGEWIGSVQLNGCFTYDGKTATATQVSAYHSTASGWNYGGEKTWCSGNSVNLTARFTHWGSPVEVSAKLSCSPTGVLS
ncbi:MAG TPA: hypothetical protein H9985_06375 [Candidatus Anaerofilum faecale]|nr:hypothetical protein [Candidatus Anaerofilum faecale]